MLLLSVVIPCHNQRDNLPHLLQSLEQQTLDTDLFEVVAADDGSTDNTWEFLQSYRGPLALKTVRLHGAGGPARARNAAFKTTEGKFILFLDGDMTAHPDLLKTHALALLTEPHTVNIARVEPSEAERDSMLAWYRVSRGAFKLGHFASIPPKYFRSNNASVARALIDTTGGFNEAYGEPGGEDLEIGFRFFRKGANFHVLRNAVAYHHHPLTLDQYKEKTARYAKENLRRLLSDCPEHGQRGYLFLFCAQHKAVRFLLEAFFARPWFFLAHLLVMRLPFRNASYRLYDYITYYVIFHNLDEQKRHA